MPHIARWQDSHNHLKTKTVNVIAGDIGGTKSWLVWFVHSLHQPQQIVFEQSYESARFADAVALLRQFIEDAGRTIPPDVLCLALPGPLQQRRVELTNLTWVVDADELSRELSVPDVRFVNDFQAAASGVDTLKKSDYLVLNAGVIRPAATRVITGAGTGLGIAWMLVDGAGNYQTFASEGGHSDFAPSDQLQCDLFLWLRQSYGHVSWERLLSGAGMAAIYEFCCIQAAIDTATPKLTAVQIHQLALHQDTLALTAIQLFVGIYAGWIGNLCLLFQPGAGLYIAGGIAIHLQSWLVQEQFLLTSCNKGRMRELVQRTPIYLVTNPRLGVQGAMHIAIS